jgi:hypothetical protein
MPENRTPIGELGSGLYFPNNSNIVSGNQNGVFKTVTVGAGSLINTPSIEADDFIILGGTSGGLTILSTSTGSGNIYFGDETTATVGLIKYNHSTNDLFFGAGNTSMALTVNRTLQLRETDDNTPNLSINMSGALFISGGIWWAKNFNGTYKQLS